MFGKFSSVAEENATDITTKPEKVKELKAKAKEEKLKSFHTY